MPRSASGRLIPARPRHAAPVALPTCFGRCEGPCLDDLTRDLLDRLPWKWLGAIAAALLAATWAALSNVTSSDPTAVAIARGALLGCTAGFAIVATAAALKVIHATHPAPPRRIVVHSVLSPDDRRRIDDARRLGAIYSKVREFRDEAREFAGNNGVTRGDLTRWHTDVRELLRLELSNRYLDMWDRELDKADTAASEDGGFGEPLGVRRSFDALGNLLTAWVDGAEPITRLALLRPGVDRPVQPGDDPD